MCYCISQIEVIFVTSQTPKFKTDNHDTIFFRWQFLLLTVNTQTNYVQYFFMNTLSYQVDIY